MGVIGSLFLGWNCQPSTLDWKKSTKVFLLGLYDHGLFGLSLLYCPFVCLLSSLVNLIFLRPFFLWERAKNRLGRENEFFNPFLDKSRSLCHEVFLPIILGFLVLFIGFWRFLPWPSGGGTIGYGISEKRRIVSINEPPGSRPFWPWRSATSGFGRSSTPVPCTS